VKPPFNDSLEEAVDLDTELLRKFNAEIASFGSMKLNFK
jgi:hypothetical protein